MSTTMATSWHDDRVTMPEAIAGANAHYAHSNSSSEVLPSRTRADTERHIGELVAARNNVAAANEQVQSSARHVLSDIEELSYVLGRYFPDELSSLESQINTTRFDLEESLDRMYAQVGIEIINSA